METSRLQLVPATAETMALAANGDSAALRRALMADVPADWPPRIDDDGEMAREGFKFVQGVLERAPSLQGWWGWWVLLRRPQTLVGIVSPKGPPNGEGTVELSYGIVASHQGKGYATEATKALVDWVCRDPRTRRIVADTLPRLGASIAVMEKCGMSFLGEGSEPGAVRYGRICRA
jgi:RimJ/RimL family protein N-acetyltransferase